MVRDEEERVLENISVSYVLEYFPNNCVRLHPQVKSHDSKVRTALVRARVLDDKGTEIRVTKYIEVSSDGQLKRVPSLPHVSPVEFFIRDRADVVTVTVSELT